MEQRRKFRKRSLGFREDETLRVIYRHYATLYFAFVVDEAESELGILDLIQVSSKQREFWTEKES